MYVIDKTQSTAQLQHGWKIKLCPPDLKLLELHSAGVKATSLCVRVCVCVFSRIANICCSINFFSSTLTAFFSPAEKSISIA